MCSLEAVRGWPREFLLCPLQEALGLVTQLLARADFGLGAREAHACGWVLGSSAPEAPGLGFG